MGQWNSKWIGYDYDPRHDLGVFAFRSTLELTAVPSSFPIRISADNRYKLYVNGAMVAFGPQRGDAQHWFYDEVDLALHLKSGENQIVALVWNFGWMAPMAQHTVRTGFVVDGERLDTPGTWEVARFEGWGFEMMHSEIEGFYIDIGPGEVIGPDLLPTPNSKLQSLNWKEPNVICSAEDRGSNGGGTPWMLIPRSLPPMRYDRHEARPTICRRFIGDDLSPDLSLLGNNEVLDGPVGLVPGSKLLLDYGVLLCAYPRLVLSGPEGTAVRVTYSEAMWQEDGGKGNRNEVAGKRMRGYQDELILGPEPSVYEPLWWRTYRYLMVEATSIQQSSNRQSSNPVTLHSIEALETGYPLKAESSFQADDPDVPKIWEVSLRTAERCAGETYFDCPYYEQLQYVGDTRIQALIGYYLGRDRRLQRNAVENLGWSLMENGLTQSRYPSRQTQVIPPFSLWWVMMLYDQMLYDAVADLESGRYIASALNVLTAFIRNSYRQAAEREDGFFWNFGDWVPAWRWGVPPGGCMSTMHQLTHDLASLANTCSIQFRLAQSSESESLPFKMPKAKPGLAREYWEDQVKAHLKGGDLARHTFDQEWAASEHSEAILRCIQSLVGLEPDPWPTEALAKANAAKCTYYFSYYKHLAMFGREDAPFDYMDELKPWKEMIENGLTTFAENPEPVRSDCHAWSAHPILGFFQIVAGVTSVAPGWKKARIAPKPGSLKRFDARIAHPDGELRVAFESGKLTIDTPVPAQFVWRGKKAELKPGKHSI